MCLAQLEFHMLFFKATIGHIDVKVGFKSEHEIQYLYVFLCLRFLGLLFSALPFVGMCAKNTYISRKV